MHAITSTPSLRAPLLLLACALFAIPASRTPVRCAAAPPPSCVILEYGLVVAESPRIRHADPTAASGEWSQIELVRFVEQTRVIPAELGRTFGFRYYLRGLSAGARVTWRSTYPEPGMRDHHGWQQTGFGPHGWGGFTFDHDWEIVRGNWRFDVLVDGQLTCSMQFDVK
jgi:hypothetical protein